jgi:adenine-specific DNA methylase
MHNRLIEEKFPIQEISELAIPERSSYKPIYQISKWFARRSASIFRAILLGSILEPSADLMNEFYKEHDFSNITVIDPFMGGGTTIIEGLRLGLNCIGIDLNPIAWFITKTEAEMIDLEELQWWIQDCKEKIEQNIKKWYKTDCPKCNRRADIIYAHWVKCLSCNHCNTDIPLFKSFLVGVKGDKASIYCPKCETVSTCLTPLSNSITCPKCQYEFNPSKGNRQGRNMCSCRKCGKTTNILEVLQKNEAFLKSKLFAIEGYCPHCAMEKKSDISLRNTRFKFIKEISKSDILLYRDAEVHWNKVSKNKLWPSEKIPFGEATKTLHNHNYREWIHLFNKRQLLALSILFEYIHKMSDSLYQEMFLAAFINLLNHNNSFTRYSPKGRKVEGIFARHDFHPLATFAENNVWGTKYGRGSWVKCLHRLIKGKEYNYKPYNYRKVCLDDNKKKKEKIYLGNVDGKLVLDQKSGRFSQNENLLLICHDSGDIKEVPFSVDLIISDPPYADNVNYSELSDFFYVWLRLILKDRYPFFSLSETPKDTEAIESRTRSLDYYDKLFEIFKVIKSKLKSEGLFVFTFHHSLSRTWLKLAKVISNAGFKVVKTYPIPSEARNTLNIQKKRVIAFDLIIVCRIRSPHSQNTINLEDFKGLFKKNYEKNLILYEEANIKVQDLDFLAIYYGTLLELDSKYQVEGPSKHFLKRNEIWEACREIVKLPI